MIMISNLLLNLINVCVIVSFLTKLLTLGILFSTAVREVLVAKLVLLVLSPLTSFILALREVSTGTGINLSTSNLSTLLFKLHKLVGTFFNLSICNLSTLDIRLAESTFLAKNDISIPVTFYKSVFVAGLDKSNSTFSFPKDFGPGKYSLIYTMSFLLIQLLNELS